MLAGITLAYLLLEWSHLSLLRIVSHTLLAVVTVSFLWNNIASFTNRYRNSSYNTLTDFIKRLSLKAYKAVKALCLPMLQCLLFCLLAAR